MSVRSVLLWHLHQPDYRDPQTGQPILPWVRLHASRAYNDMAAALERHERVRVVANFSPSLLLQLQAYAQGASVDLDEALARKPASALSPAERAHVLKASFSAAWDVWVKPVPRYRELLQRRGADLRGVDLLRRQLEFNEQELRDLQVHFVLAWMGFAARSEEPLARELVDKGRGFTEAEKVALLDIQRRIAARILPRWRALSERGQVEITGSPLYHPILPLLVDTESARRAMPEVALPPRFRHPEDAREQVDRALDCVEQSFGRRPVGMWPSEGSVSPEVIELLGACGMRWCATDEGVLARSELDPERPPSPGGAPHHQPYAAGAEDEVCVLFRDRELSDLIGFRYARSDANEAAEDLVRRLSAAQTKEGQGALVTLALDGENPWEHYPRSGELFLDALYGALATGKVTTVLPREELAEHPPRARIRRIHSGSWIDACYRIWIGHSEDNQAWALLGAAREELEEAGRDGALPPAQIEAARECLLVAEGSDWFWWYGDDFTTENAPEFDALFRRRLEAAYRHLGLAPPERLSRPIIAPHKDVLQAAAVFVPQRRFIEPVVDGYARAYYEWSGAGVYRPASTSGGSMFRGAGAFHQLWFGFSCRELFLRLDPAKGTQIEGELRLLLSCERGAVPGGRREKTVRMRLLSGAESEAVDEQGAKCGRGGCGSIVELALSLEALGLLPGDRIALFIRVLRDGAELDRLPRYGELALSVPDRKFQGAYWQV